jgi:uncharacterized membrane protein
MDLHSPFARAILVLHSIAGSAAVLVGLVPLVSNKGGAFHRRWGTRFMRIMVVVIGSAVTLTLIGRSPYFAGLTASALLTVFSGWRVLQRRRPDLSSEDRAKAIDWVVTLGCTAVAFLLLYLGHSGRVTANLPVLLSLAYGTLLYAAWDIWRFVAPLSAPFSPQLWLYEHIVKIIGAYFATVAAFSGSVLHFLPSPWKQLWAVSLGQILAVAFVLRYRNRTRRSRLPTQRPMFADLP